MPLLHLAKAGLPGALLGTLPIATAYYHCQLLLPIAKYHCLLSLLIPIAHCHCHCQLQLPMPIADERRLVRARCGVSPVDHILEVQVASALTHTTQPGFPASRLACWLKRGCLGAILNRQKRKAIAQLPPSNHQSLVSPPPVHKDLTALWYLRIDQWQYENERLYGGIWKSTTERLFPRTETC